MSRLSVSSFVCLLAIACLSAGPAVAQQAAPALTGTVTAGPEALEGVLVSAKKSGSTITTTVVSGKDGRYDFPAGRLEPGAYSLRIRAVGYDLEGPAEISVVPEKTTTADLKLRAAKDIASQLTNALEHKQLVPVEVGLILFSPARIGFAVETILRVSAEFADDQRLIVSNLPNGLVDLLRRVLIPSDVFIESNDIERFAERIVDDLRHPLRAHQ